MLSDTITIGADPEIFVLDKTLVKVVSAHGLIDGDKRHPVRVEKGALQIDGMALEFNIDPAETLEDFLTNISYVTQALADKVRERNPNLEFVIQPVAHFTQDYLDTVPEDAKRLGCEPDFNAYTGKMNKPPDGKTLMRTASGHVHVGWTEGEDPLDKAHFRDCQIVVKQLDAALYSLSTLWDGDTLRRKLYGAKGAFRPKSYGTEYRVLSNKWLASKAMQAWIFQATRQAMSLLTQGIHLYIDDVYHTRSPEYCHDKLVTEYNFPSLPGMKRPAKGSDIWN